GGVGGLVGAALAHAGDPVTLILRREVAAGYPPVLSLDSPFGKFVVPVERATTVSQPLDVLWIAVKATQLDTALDLISNGNEHGAIVPLLNGVDHVALLRSRFGHDRVVPATIAVESERVSPGVIVHRSSFVRLNVSSMGRERLGPAIGKLQQFGFACQFVDDEATLMWSKLAFLAPMALASTAAARDKGGLVSDPVWRQRLESSVAEVCAVAAAGGAKVDPANILKFIEGLKPGIRSSMQKDVEAGKPPELDAIAGPILRGAQARGLAVPVIQELVGMVRARLRT
ncbi:MAG TPA: 2-dehydropantoate 2-reductase, partial [Terriglobales bacterium]|nr:2-dehydropantoate 2-reductase [Terriglobales bacterium]